MLLFVSSKRVLIDALLRLMDILVAYKYCGELRSAAVCARYCKLELVTGLLAGEDLCKIILDRDVLSVSLEDDVSLLKT